MFLNLREMEPRKLCFEETYPPGEIQFPDARLRQVSPLRVTGSAELLPNTEGEIRVLGHLSVRMDAECDRCLDEVASYPLEIDFDLFYQPANAMPPAEEVQIDAGESEIGFYEGEGLELGEALREQILLALPMQKTCREDCKGICPVCGQNRNVAGCGCQVKPLDDRWAALREL